MSQPTVLFIHRSVGQNIIRDGAIYDLVEKSGREFLLSDFNQNTGMLTDWNKPPRQTGWTFSGNDTTPADYAQLFSNERLRSGDSMLKAILDHDLIAIKSCYPNSNIRSDRELATLQTNYQQITSFFAQQTRKKLIILTSPPLLWYMTTEANAARARKLSRWLVSTDFGPNIFVYDLFDDLASKPGELQANTLRKAYRRWLPFDPHPNARASRAIAPRVIAFFEATAAK